MKPFTLALAAGLLLAGAAGLASPARAAGDTADEAAAERPLVLSTPGLQPGERFACSIPIDIRYEGEAPPDRVVIIASVFAEDELLGSTGLTPGNRPLVAERQGDVLDYEQIPLQFDIAEEQCERIDGLRLDFARCRFEDGPAEPCLELIRFADAPAGEPLFLPLRAAAVD